MILSLCFTLFGCFCVYAVDILPNDGDIKVVEGVGGNFRIAVDEDEVIMLTRETFNHVIMTRPTILVEFYAPWCGHCKTLAPEYAKAAKELKKLNIPLAKVDSTKEVEIAKEHMVTGFPTLTLFKGGEKVEEYNGDYSAEGIIEYMREKADPNWKPPKSSVLEANTENFDNLIKDQPLVLVEFYATYCRHCQQLAPEYEAAARRLKETRVRLIKVDGVKEKALSDAFQIKGWPTLKIFRNGRPYEYKGPRDSKGIVEYMREQLKFPSKEVFNELELKNNLDRLEATIVGFFSNKSDFFNEFTVASNEIRGTYRILHTFDENTLSYYEMNPDTVAVFQPEITHTQYENKIYRLHKPVGTFKDILNFVEEKGTPLVGLRSKHNIGFKYTERPLVVVYYDVNYDYQYVKDTEFVRKKIVKVAREFTAEHPFQFAISNEEEFAEELKYVGLEDATEDVKVVVYDRQNKFRMNPVDDFEAEDLLEFLQELIEGKHKPYYRSQSIPKVQEGPVKVIVANSFQSEVLESKKDVLLEIYAPWCGHCKALEPVYKKLALKMSNENLIIAKYDGSANDIPPLFGQIKGYPTIFFIPAFKKEEFVIYDGPKNYTDLKEFINENSSVFLTDEERIGENAIGDNTKDEL
ncbi:probable protein disulfide-isomerase A4 isoform X1 [Artemia franciscana]|uniref:probable protein disulfide-isomerase A4 isoform X1 n=1 Tax=Artemia franciscana TaxID=6661 RepID=UPI0032DB5C29